MRNHRLVVLSLSLIVAGCECQRNVTSTVSGDVRWEWESADGLESDVKARVDFPITTMGGRRDARLWVRNVGRAPLTMTEFAQLMGAPTTLNSQLASQAAFEVRWTADLVLDPTERTEVLVAFTPPVTENRSTAEYESFLELRPQGAAASPLTLSGKAIAGQCDVPETIDFGSVPLRSTLSSDISLRNDGAASVKVVAGGVTGAPVGVFTLMGLTDGTLTVAAGSAPNLTVTFSPSEPGDFTGQFTVRRADSCPQRTVTVKGRGVNSCITWKAEPPDDPQGLGLHFGAVPPSSAGPGKVTFSNTCSVAAELSNLHTTDPVFVVTAAAPQDLTSLLLPAATRDPSGTWTDGTAVTQLEFRPLALGGKVGSLQAATSLASQPGVAISLKGFGGGPRIDVRPSPLFAIGRIGFTPGSMPATFVQRTLRVANVGNRPTPADPRANLFLGPNGTGPTFFEVHAINGTDAEICVGEWDAMTGSCTNTVSTALYDPAVGIEASPTAALNLPVRVMPQTAGLKEWEVVVYSNDVSNPEARVRITAEALAGPPCNYTLAPTTLSFGVLETTPVDLSFTLTNLGTTPQEVCYFNGLGLSPTTDPVFSLPSNPVDLMLNAGQSASVSVRATPLGMPTTTTLATGEVIFNVSTPGAPQASVALQATQAPSCLTVSPSPLTFADTQLECGSPERALVISNTCPNAVTLNSTLITDPALAPNGTGTCATAGGCPQFVITSAPAGGSIAPGASRTVLVRFRPYLTGAQAGVLTVTTQQGAATIPYNIPLSGNGIARTQASCGLQLGCPSPMTVNANSTITLAPTQLMGGTAPLSCAWSAGMRPATSNGTFSSPTSCTSTSYFADVVGTHVISFNVTDALGYTAQCQTPVTVIANGDLWIELTWDRNNDVDLHLLHPNGGSPLTSTSWFNTTWDCNYRNLRPSWSANAQASPSLDRDDILGRGPENMRINSPDLGVDYAIGAHMYDYDAASPVTSTVKVYCGGQLITTQTRTMSRAKDMWVVGSVRFQTAAVPCTFTPNGTVIVVP
ncbi:MAG: choice-of-anchor D domain-containing protein [Myxococcota bacterium]